MDRQNIILSSQAESLNQQNKDKNVKFFSSFEEAYSSCKKQDEIFIIGGEKVYRYCLPMTDKILLTLVHHTYEGDTFFPPFENSFKETAREDYEENNIKFSFITYLRK
ncbi:MAG: dihydrofolate reductase [Silvanigrellaceae bacterium]|nr:dihydrofolate reductase [Silvanigrellaceae bacterium]